MQKPALPKVTAPPGAAASTDWSKLGYKGLDPGPRLKQLSMALPAPELPKAPAEVPAGSAQGSTPRSARFCFRPACPAGVVPGALPEAGSACQTTSQRPLLRNTSDEDFTLQVIIPRPSAATSRSCWRLALVTDP